MGFKSSVFRHMDGLAAWAASGLENRDDSFGMGVRLLGHPPYILAGGMYRNASSQPAPCSPPV